MSGNQTLFKQSSSETEDGETKIISAKVKQDHLRVRQTKQKQPPVLQLVSCFRVKGLTQWPSVHHRLNPSKSPFFFNLFTRNSAPGCKMELWLSGALTEAPLCAGVHIIAGPTRPSWTLLATAEWPQTWALPVR